VSETYTRKQVKCVSAAPIAAGGVILAFLLGAAVLKSLSKAAQNACAEKSGRAAAKPLHIQSGVSLAEQEPLHTESLHALSLVERIKVSALAALHNSGCVVEKTNTLMQKMEALRTADNVVDVCEARQDLYLAVENHHEALFAKSMTLACENASVKAGFAHVETKETSDGKAIRIIATDDQGRSIVSEVSGWNNHNKQIVSELIGVRDGSCKMLMNRFDLALQAEGVVSLPPERKFTGGVCDTNAACDFIRKVAESLRPGGSVRKSEKAQNRRLRSLNPITVIKSK